MALLTHVTFTYRLAVIQAESVAVSHRHKAAPPFPSLLQVLIETPREDAVACQRVLQDENSHLKPEHGCEAKIQSTMGDCLAAQMWRIDDTCGCENDKFQEETSLNCARSLNLKRSFQTFRVREES